MNKGDLSYYYPKKSLTVDCYNSKKMIKVKNPRDHALFVDGIDNLTPVFSLLSLDCWD